MLDNFIPMATYRGDEAGWWWTVFSGAGSRATAL